MEDRKEGWDVLIVGSGAGGGPLALALSQAGMEVLVLEKGPRYQRSAYRHDEILISEAFGFFVPKLTEDPHVLMNGEGREKKPELSHLGWTASCVGGGTAHMGGFVYRFHPDDFRLRSRCGEFEAIADWPYGYEELEPYYSRAEWEIGISGTAGANPFEGPRSRSYPMPPLASHPLTGALDKACGSLGLHSFPTPRAVNSQAYQGRPACGFCDSCGGYGCPTGARGSTQEALLPRAEQTGRCEVRPNSMVREITVRRDGRAGGCIYLDEEGVEHRIQARVVCVCCSAVESARLLLMSKSSLFPDGLANGSGLVGRNLQFHTNSTGRARFRLSSRPELSTERDNFFLGRSVMDHYFLPDGVSPLPKGGTIRFGIASPDPISVARRLLRDGDQVVWGEPLKRRLQEYYQNTVETVFEVFQDFIPNSGTYVELDPEVTDRWGLPSARIYLDSPDHHEVASRWLLERGLEIFDEMGADEIGEGSFGNVSEVLVHGTCRAGTEPSTSVLDDFCRAHEVPNLFVVDGSFMPTSGGAAPTLTIFANSFRTADHIIEEANKGTFGS